MVRDGGDDRKKKIHEQPPPIYELDGREEAHRFTTPFHPEDPLQVEPLSLLS